MPRFGYKKKLEKPEGPSEEYRLGRADRTRGVDVFRCPFDGRTLRGREWFRGWVAENKEMADASPT